MKTNKEMVASKPLAEPTVTSVPFAALQEQGGVFDDDEVKNPKGKENPEEKKRDMKNGK